VELRKVQSERSPLRKMNAVFRAFKMVERTFALYGADMTNQSACADDLLQIFPYVLLKAGIPKLKTIIQFIKEFGQGFMRQDAKNYAFK